MDLPVNKALLWDVAEARPQDEAFRRFYVKRVLERGGAADVRALGLPTIRRYLSGLRLPPDLDRFWRWYLARLDAANGPPDARAARAG